MNNNMTTERAHLGVFSTNSYISIGDLYGKKSDKDPRLLGKQFSHFFPTHGIAGARPNNSLFDREHKWLFGGEKCAQRCASLLLRCHMKKTRADRMRHLPHFQIRRSHPLHPDTAACRPQERLLFIGRKPP